MVMTKVCQWRKIVVLMASMGSLALGLAMAVLSSFSLLCVGPQLHWGPTTEPHCTTDSLIDEWAAIRSLSDYISHQPEPDRNACRKTCKLEVVESIPENLTFGDAKLPRSTYEAWRQLLMTAEEEIDIAAYKSSLRGKHVLSQPSLSAFPGEDIFRMIVKAGKERHVNIRMVENFPPKDFGDNEDGMSLERRGVVDRRPLHFARLYGAGTMHSKFLIADKKHFYVGSANLDWRSLSQKMELGLLVLDCPCLAADLRKVFDTYWALTSIQNMSVCEGSNRAANRAQITKYLADSDTQINKQNPLSISYKGVETSVYIAASPTDLNSAGRTWDLDSILETINSAQQYIYIHVMDYIPMMVYREPQRYWPIIDDAVRRAAVDRGVEVKLLVAALHFVPKMLYFMKSLQDVNGAASIDGGSIDIKIFKVPVITEYQTVVNRDRRTHNKFMVTEDTVIIGTSNWSGDYFYGNTGVALVMKQQQNGNKQPFIEEMRDIFLRDWTSDYAHPLGTYMKKCLWRRDGSMCETEKEETNH